MSKADPSAASGPPPGLIVAGMHRSGTSMVASSLGEVGWALGEDLMAARKWNPRGYFEDRQLSHLHDRMLAGYGLAWNDVAGLRSVRHRRLDILPTHLDEAHRLIAAYRDSGPWVWKNPRATLFLHAWTELLPEATVVVVVRQPAGSIDSLVRRGSGLAVAKDARLRKARQLERAHSLWRSYSFAALDFAKAHPERVVAVRVPEDMPILQRMAGQAVEPTLLGDAGSGARLVASAPSTVRLHRELAALADPARVTELMRGPDQQVETPA